MCLSKPKAPKAIPPPAPVLPPVSPNKAAVVKKGGKKKVTVAGKTRRRGTARSGLVVSPSGLNNGGKGGTGIYV